jgi:arabinan endo-1,5-alpha-L-arabinosidase
MQRPYPRHTPHSSHSKVFPFLAAMGISTLATLATFLPLLFRFGLTAPLPEGDTTIYSSSSLYPDPNPCYGNNSGIHDPSIIYEDGTYWRFSTSGNIAVATAPSMKGPWKYQGPLLPQGTKIRVADDQDIWVPYSGSLIAKGYDG